MIVSYGSVNTRRAGPRLRALTAGTLAMGMALAVVPLLAGPAAAQGTCTPNGNQATCTFDFTGAAENFTVPSGVTQLTVVARGASGGAGAGDVNPGGAGGAGAEVTGTLPVTPGQVLQVTVGGAGGDASETTPGTAGFNGGADGGPSDHSSGGGGGGASDIRSAFGLDSRVVTAGGGGGGGGTTELTGGGGGAGGRSGADGINGAGGTDTTGGRGGGGATPTAPGAPGAGGVGVNRNGDDGQPGALGTGGTGGEASINSGGGGGGGVYGGGGGGGGATTDVLFSGGGGGGGGSSAGPAGSTFTTGANTGNGHVTLTYATASQPVTTYLKSKPNPSWPGEPVKLTDRVCPSHQTSGAPRPTGSVSFTVDGTRVGTAQLRPDGDNCSVAGLTVRNVGAAGTHTITATYSGDATYQSNRGNPETLTHVVRRCVDRGHDHDHGDKGSGKEDSRWPMTCPPRAGR